MVHYPQDWSHLKVALAHDWLTGMRGGERVLELLGDGFPDAPIHTLLHNPARISDRINRHTIHTSPLQRIPRIDQTYRYFLPVYTWAISRFQPAPADLLISTSHCVAKGLPRPPGARHLCYCFTPMRYAWTFYEEYFGRNPIKKSLLGPLLRHLRRWDHDHAQSVDRFVAISHHVQQRIERFYGREADVVYPPVDTDRCTPDPNGGHDGYDLIVSALVPYKRVDLAVRTYTELGYPLRVIGTGTEFERLRAVAGANIQFTGWLSDDDILAAYRRCRFLVFPGEEDFGIVPVEAQACGKPVLAYAKGGALETVVATETGVFFDEQTPESLRAAIDRATRIQWDPAHIRQHALGFSNQHFIDGLAVSIHKCLQPNG
jgi:glycosyltransferase involved in cell wall biosynthesis